MIFVIAKVAGVLSWHTRASLQESGGIGRGLATELVAEAGGLASAFGAVVVPGVGFVLDSGLPTKVGMC